MSSQGKNHFYKSRRFWSIVLLSGLVVAFQRPALSEVAAFLAEVVCARQGLEFDAESVKAGLFEPLSMQGVSLRVNDRESDSGSTLEIESLSLEWQSPLGLVSKPSQLVRAIGMKRMNLWIDLRKSENGEIPPHAWRPLAVLAGISSLGGSWPAQIDIESSTVELSGDSTRWVLEGFGLFLREKEPGSFHADTLVIHSPGFEKVFGPLSAKTAWDGERLSVAGLDMLPGVMMNEISCEIPHGGEPSISFTARVCGGVLRGDWFFHQGERGSVWDFAAVCSNVNLEEISEALDLGGRARGLLAEGRFTYRGSPSRPTDAEASLWVLAKDFRWNDRGWESLEIGASLIHRRLFVSNFDLQQKENKVAINGEISLAEGWSKITEAPFLLNLRANIQELGSLASLTASSLEEVRGELKAEGSLSGRPGSLDGFVGVKAKGVEYQGAKLELAELEILFQKKTAEIVRCEVKSGSDILRANGRIGISAPHAYKADIDATVSDFAAWLRPFPALGGGVVSSGAMNLDWSGEGSLNGHSGVFDVDLSKFVSAYTPAGLTGHFAATYSPENIHFSEALLENGKLRMQSRITLSKSGVNFDDVQLKADGKALLHGKAFLPLDPFTVASLPNWKSAIFESEATYLEANTPEDLDLAELVNLAGQNWPLAGLLKMQLQAYGPAAEINGKLSLQAREVFFGKEATAAPSSIELSLKSSGGSASLNGEMLNSAMNPLHFKAAFPFGLFKDAEGNMQWIRCDAPIEAALDFPRADLSLLRPFFQNLPALSGELSGRLRVSGTLDKPMADGSAEIRNASFFCSSLGTPAEYVAARLEISESAVRILDVAGEISPGRFELSGVCEFPAPWNPKWSLSWRGERIPLVNNELATLLADVELSAEGDSTAGILQGVVRLVDSEIRSKIDVRPLLSATGTNGLDFEMHTRTLKNLSPASNWLLDVGVGCSEPIRLAAQKFAGQIKPSLRLQGIVGNPIPVGNVVLEGLEFETSGGLWFADRVDLEFFPDKPSEPFVFGMASGIFGGFALEAVAFGPLAEGKWFLQTSDPMSPPPQSLLLLLRDGLVPLPLPAGQIAPSEFFLVARSVDPAFAVPLRIEDQSLAGGGIRFSDSLDFSLRGALLPMGTFEQGFEWKWDPKF
jgi:hypothetical protein